MVFAAAPKAMWYLARGSGIVSLLLLTATMVLGLLTVGRWSPRRTDRFVVTELHRNLSLLSVVFLAVHVASVVIDGFVPIRWLDVVIPFGAAYQPFWLGLGAVAVDVLLAVTATSLLRTRLSHRSWRTVHWLAYLCWPVAVLHGLGLGSDRGQLWMIAIEGLCIGAVAIAGLWRLGRSVAHQRVMSAPPSQISVGGQP